MSMISIVGGCHQDHMQNNVFTHPLQPREVVFKGCGIQKDREGVWRESIRSPRQ